MRFSIPTEPDASLLRRLRVWLAWGLARAIDAAARLAFVPVVALRGAPIAGSEGPPTIDRRGAAAAEREARAAYSAIRTIPGHESRERARKRRKT